MVSKNIRFFEVKMINICLLLFTILFNFNSFSQTVSDVFPTRVTSGSKITVLGTGFLSVNTSNISIGGISIDASSIDIVSDTELTFLISDTFLFELPPSLIIPYNPDPVDALNRVLTVDGVTITGANATKRISYISPTLKDYGIDKAQIEITEVFTDWNYLDEDTGTSYPYYRSDWYRNAKPFTYPSTNHNLLAFTVAGVTYSTGVNDALLDADNNGVFDIAGANGKSYTPQVFKAYSTNGVSGFPKNDNYLLMADEIDGAIDATILNAQVSATAYDVIIDGVNGLDMGTGIANFNQDTDVRFFSGNGIVGAVSDNIPDLIITQIATPGLTGTDLYYYADIDGNIVGRPIRLRIDRRERNILFKWDLDIYTMNTSVPYNISYPTGTAFRGDEKRQFIMVGLKLSDFSIDNNPSSTNFIGDINNINTLAGGSADMAFLAYNKAAFDIKSPVVDEFPIARNICKVPSTGNTIEFSALGSVDSPTGNPGETITYQWYKDFVATGPTTSTWTLPSTIGLSDLGNYKVRISNNFGAIDLPVTLSEGGTPTLWNGTSWELPSALAGITVSDDERNLIFGEDYSSNVDLVGCDCRVLRDRVVTIPANRTLKLYGEIIVEEDLDIYNEFGGFVETIPAGEITFGNNASLLQTKAVAVNENSGDIRMNRDATDLNTFDYIYWSSPVANFNIGNIPGTLAYKWDPTVGNSRGTSGDWLNASGIMNVGEGYIKRVPSDSDFTTTFTGVPNN
ncbi:MAG: hypothetical protein NWP87_00155, partial [Winogradskyella sp.]|nr:hypothetical protein [Winogradskyella sp.]